MLAPVNSQPIVAFANFRMDRPWFWHGLLTAPRREPIAAEWLAKQMKLSIFLPQFIVRTACGNGRRCPVLKPVVPGYLFLPSYAGFDVPWAAIRKVPGIRGRGYVSNDQGHPATILDREIDWLRQLEGELNQPPPAKVVVTIVVGQQARIVDGPFIGFVGPVCAIANDARISVKLPLFGGPTSVWVPSSQIEAIEQGPVGRAGRIPS